MAAGVGRRRQQALPGRGRPLVAQAGGGPDAAPAFVALLGGLLVACAAFVLWLELLVRAAAVYVAVLFLPLALASLVWPAISHWCRRLVDTLVALVLAKFVIVAILSLAAGALASGTGTGFASVLGGAALLLLAAFAPFTLLRLVPMVEAGAVHQLEGARHRVAHALASTAPVRRDFALRAGGARSLATGEPGTGVAPDFGVPGDGDPACRGAGAVHRRRGGRGAGRGGGGGDGGAGAAGGRRRGGGRGGSGGGRRRPATGRGAPRPAGHPALARVAPALDGSGPALPAPAGGPRTTPTVAGRSRCGRRHRARRCRRPARRTRHRPARERSGPGEEPSPPPPVRALRGTPAAPVARR